MPESLLTLRSLLVDEKRARMGRKGEENAEHFQFFNFLSSLFRMLFWIPGTSDLKLSSAYFRGSEDIHQTYMTAFEDSLVATQAFWSWLIVCGVHARELLGCSSFLGAQLQWRGGCGFFKVKGPAVHDPLNCRRVDYLSVYTGKNPSGPKPLNLSLFYLDSHLCKPKWIGRGNELCRQVS